MLKLNLKDSLKNLGNKPLVDEKKAPIELGKTIANIILASPATKEPARCYVMASKLYQEKEIELSKEDLDFIVAQVEAVPITTTPTLIKGQILNILKDVN